MNKNYKFLENINFPSDIKKLSQSDLKILAKEVREEMIDAVSETGGHLGAGLGVVELTVAIHYIFNTITSTLSSCHRNCAICARIITSILNF